MILSTKPLCKPFPLPSSADLGSLVLIFRHSPELTTLRLQIPPKVSFLKSVCCCSFDFTLNFNKQVKFTDASALEPKPARSADDTASLANLHTQSFQMEVHRKRGWGRLYHKGWKNKKQIWKFLLNEVRFWGFFVYLDMAKDTDWSCFFLSLLVCSLKMEISTT